jgi:hypothetical protein
MEGDVEDGDVGTESAWGSGDVSTELGPDAEGVLSCEVCKADSVGDSGNIRFTKSGKRTGAPIAVITAAIAAMIAAQPAKSFFKALYLHSLDVSHPQS